MRISSSTYQLTFLLLLGALLRFTGITWGIPIAMPGIDAYFIDETWMMEAFAQMNPVIGDFSPDMGYREGGLSYFIISAVFIFLKSINVLKGLPNEVLLHSYDYGMLVFVGRCVVASFGVASIAIVFFTLKLICRTSWAPFIGALSLVIFPFDVIYSHYLRAHIIGNTFLVLAIFFSFQSYNNKRLSSLIFAGISVGLATATRYTMIAATIFPAFAIILIAAEANRRKLLQRLLAQKESYIVISSIAFGFILGCPHIIFDHKLVLNEIFFLSSFTAKSEFSYEQILNLTRLKAFIFKLIPDGTGPSLWVAFYASLLYLPVRFRIYKYVIPILGFIIGFSFFMGKGYFASAIFVRTMLPIFPLLALSLGLAIDDLTFNFTNKRIRALIYASFVLCATPALLFSSAYVYSMSIKEDPKVSSAYFLKDIQKKSARSLNLALVGPAIPYTFPTKIISTIVNPRSVKLAYSINDVTVNWSNKYDYVILSATDYEEDLEIEQLLADSAITNAFELVAKFKRELSFFGVTFDYTGIAHDMSYPLNRVYILKNKIFSLQ